MKRLEGEEGEPNDGVAKGRVIRMLVGDSLLSISIPRGMHPVVGGKRIGKSLDYPNQVFVSDQYGNTLRFSLEEIKTLVREAEALLTVSKR